MSDWEPTLNFRWLIKREAYTSINAWDGRPKFNPPLKVLQQHWVNINTQEDEWRDVPEVANESQ